MRGKEKRIENLPSKWQSPTGWISICCTDRFHRLHPCFYIWLFHSLSIYLLRRKLYSPSFSEPPPKATESSPWPGRGKGRWNRKLALWFPRTQLNWVAFRFRYFYHLYLSFMRVWRIKIRVLERQCCKPFLKFSIKFRAFKLKFLRSCPK